VPCPGSEALAFSAALEARMGSVIRYVPGINLDVAQPPPPVSFVGGFLAALIRRGTASWI
jgi:hypothetical protein